MESETGASEACTINQLSHNIQPLRILVAVANKWACIIVCSNSQRVIVRKSYPKRR